MDTVLQVMRRVQMASYYRQAVIKVSSDVRLRKDFQALYIRKTGLGWEKLYFSSYHLIPQAAQEFSDGFIDREAFQRLFDELDKEHIKEVMFSARRKSFV